MRTIKMLEGIMKFSLLIFISLFSFSAIADACSKVAKFDEARSEIYVVCPELPSKTDTELGNIVYTIFTSNEFPPDEYVIHFVISKEFLDHKLLNTDSHIGFYYTHDNGLVIWPKNEAKKRHVQLRT